MGLGKLAGLMATGIASGLYLSFPLMLFDFVIVVASRNTNACLAYTLSLFCRAVFHHIYLGVRGGGSTSAFFILL